MNKAGIFRELHNASEPLVLPNAWDIGSARLMEIAGFKAIATTSAGIAFAHGLADGNHLAPEIVFEDVAAIIKSVSIPVTMDIETGYGDVAGSILQAKVIGAVGANIEDATGTTPDDLFDIHHACDAVALAKQAGGQDFFLNARTDTYLTNHTYALKETILRGNAYVESGADCVFIPGVNSKEDIKTLVNEINAPINILAGVGQTPLSMNDYKECGVTRVTTGGSLVRKAYTAMMLSLDDIKEAGDFSYAAKTISHNDMNKMMGVKR